MSSLGEVFSWKNSDSSKNVNDSESTQDARASTSAADGPCCATAGCSSSPVKTDQPPAVTDHGSGADPQPSDSVGGCGCQHGARCCDAPASADVETSSKNTQTPSKSSSGSKKNHWALRFNCRPKSKSSKCCDPPEAAPEPVEVKCDSCVCTRYRRTDDHHSVAGAVYDVEPVDQPEPYDDEADNLSMHDNMLDFEGAFSAFHSFDNPHSQLVLPSFDEGIMDLHADFIGEEFTNEDFEDRAYKERAKEIQEGIDPPPGFRPGLHLQLKEFGLPKTAIDNLTSLFQRAAITAFNSQDDHHRVHTSIDYIHYLVPDLLQITNCSFYWGKMDRYEAEKLLENKPEGTFLLRDSAQDEYLFSVSFRKYGRSLHARIEQWNRLFSFDSRDPGVYASSTVCGLIEHYKDPTCCMFFEPMLTIPLHRNFTFSLQHTCRATVCSQIKYDDVNQLKLPKLLKSYLKEYHYKQRVRVRIFD